jgi:CheY-like chemotaxis protein
VIGRRAGLKIESPLGGDGFSERTIPIATPVSSQAQGSAGGGLNPAAVFNLTQAKVMVVDDNSYSLRLTTQMLLGFGIPTRQMCLGAEQAKQALMSQQVDLLIVDCEMPGMDGYDLVRWLRSSGLEPNAFTPVLMVSGHTRMSQVAKARDCGANFIVARPMTSTVLLERILWMARDPRPFLKAGNYMGPDRRFKMNDPQKDRDERRADVRRKKQAAAEAAAVEQQEETAA